MDRVKICQRHLKKMWKLYNYSCWRSSVIIPVTGTGCSGNIAFNGKGDGGFRRAAAKLHHQLHKERAPDFQKIIFLLAELTEVLKNFPPTNNISPVINVCNLEVVIAWIKCFILLTVRSKCIWLEKIHLIECFIEFYSRDNINSLKWTKLSLTRWKSSA